MLFQRVTCCACLVHLALLSTTTATAESEGGAHRAWAVVADDRELSKTLGTLLEAELLAADIELVERARIAAVLAEQELAAKSLTDPKHSILLGQLLAAEALIYVESFSPEKRPLLRVRVIETRTGIRLWDQILSGDLNQQVEAVARHIPLLRQKLNLDTKYRHYVSVMGFVEEDPDSHFTAEARALQVILEQDFQRHPSLVVLERSDLQLLADESDLSGIELELRAASILVAGGFRFNDENKELEVDVRLSDASGRVLKDLALMTSDLSSEQLRKHILLAVLGDDVAGTTEVDLTVEARQFELRADWLGANAAFEQALAPAYAVSVLIPSPRAFERLYDFHGQLTGSSPLSHDRSSNRLECIRHALAAHEQDLKRIELASQENAILVPGRYSIAADPFWPHIPLVKIENGDERRARDELDTLRMQKYERLRELTVNRPYQRARLLIARLALAAYFASDPDQTLDDVMQLQEEIDAAVAVISPATARESLREENTQALVRALWLVTTYSLRHGLSGDVPSLLARYSCREWDMNGIRTRCRALANHSELWIRLAYLSRVVSLDGDDACAAAEEAFTQLRNVPSRDINSDTTSITAPILRKIPECGGLERIIRAMISSAEETGDLANLPLRMVKVDRLLYKLPEHVQEELSLRVQRLTPKVVPPPVPEPWNRFELVRRDVIVTPAELDQVSSPYRNAYAVIAAAAGKYELRTRQSGTRWSADPTSLIMLPFRPRWQDHFKIEPTPLGTYCMEYGELHVIKDGEARQIGTGKSFAGYAMKYWDGKLYFTSNHGLEVLDCRTGAIENLASTLRTVQRHGLDGGAPFSVHCMRVDAKRSCLWLGLKGQEKSGIWKYSPNGDRFTHVIAGAAHLNELAGDKLFFTQDQSMAFWHVLDIESGEIEPMQGYRPFTQLRRSVEPDRLIRVGENIIGRYGTIYTRDGLQHRHPEGTTWNFIETIPEGFRGVRTGPYLAVWEFRERTKVAKPNQDPIDLLKSVDIKRDMISGKWTTDDTLTGVASQGIAKLHLPVELPAAFELRLIATPRKGSNLFVTMATGGAFFYIGIDHMRDSEKFRSGIGAVDTKGIVDNGTGVQERVLVPDQENTVVITVRPQHIDVQVNGLAIASFDGDFSRLAPERWMRSMDWPLTLACEDSSYEFSEITLTPLEASND